jgi:hypothetical protein
VLAGGPLIRGAPSGAALAGPDAAEGFRLVFAATIVCLSIALASLVAFKERPLRGANSLGGVE